MTDLREAIKAAYLAGATDVHEHWVETHPMEMRGDPEFGEAAGDYADSVILPDAEALADALEPFAECCEQIRQDEDDEEWAKFRLLIKDYRRAHAALANYRKGTGREG